MRAALLEVPIVILTGHDDSAPDGSSIEVWNGGIPTAVYISNHGGPHKFRSRYLPLGVADNDAFDAATEIFRAPPRTLMLCSDGLTEAENAACRLSGRTENFLCE